jgi:hypothetical protein
MTTAIIDRFMGNDVTDLGPREQVAVFDYDPETDDGGIWLATLPLSVIYDHGATDCRMTYDLFAARKGGAIAGAALGALALGVISYLTMGGATGAVLGLFMGSMLGAIAGWSIGHRFAPKPISVYRRVWTLASEEEMGLAKGEEPVPGHTRTPAGELVRQTVNGYWRQEVYPLRFTNIQGEEAMDDPVVVGGDVGLVGTEDRDTPVDPFDPAMIRATTQWEVMQQRLDKMLWGQHEMNTWERIQVGTAVALAAGGVGLAAFLIISTSGPAPPPEEVIWRLNALMA